MAQHDYNIANQSGLEFRQDLNNVLSAIVTQNSGATAPVDTFSGMEWLDTATSPPIKKRRNQANDAWEVILTEAGRAITSAPNAASQLGVLGAQAALISGTNIKTINGETVLGSGNIVISAASVPAGCVAHFAGSSAPTGWLKANGALVSRTTYANLFAAIGTTYGVGDGSTTFALPDLRGEFVRGLDDGRGVDSGQALGSAQAGANASHSHGAGTLSAAYAGDHTHAIALGYSGVGGAGRVSADGLAPTGTGSSGAHAHTISGSTATDGSEARPRNIALLACIKF